MNKIITTLGAAAIAISLTSAMEMTSTTSMITKDMIATTTMMKDDKMMDIKMMDKKMDDKMINSFIKPTAASMSTRLL